MKISLLYYCFCILLFVCSCKDNTAKNNKQEDSQDSNYMNNERIDSITNDKPIAPAKIFHDTLVLHDTITLHDTIENASYCISSYLDKMQVVYVGVNNKLTIDAPAGAVITAIGATIAEESQGSKQYNLRSNPGSQECILDVRIPNKPSLSKSYRYRIKHIPDPVAYVYNIKGDGLMPKAEVANIQGIFARVENFDFDVKFEAVSFELSININGVFVNYRSTGPRVTSEMQRLLSACKPGSKVIFENIIVKGPGGETRKIPGVVITVR